jgi:hypothetical protein
MALDDTLLDRSGAFMLWAKDFLDEIEAPREDLQWLLSVDADGLTPRWDLADLIRDRYQLNIPSIDILEELRGGPLEYERLDPLVGCALKIAGDAGFVPVVVTNGPGGGHRGSGRDGSAQCVAAPRAGVDGQPVRADPGRGQRDPGPVRDHGRAPINAPR